MNEGRSRLGATPRPDGHCSFEVWAPRASRIELQITAPAARREALRRDDDGYHRGVLAGVRPGARYQLSLDGGPLRPDPASKKQPEGVHGPSEVIDLERRWSDQGWRGVTLPELVLYELHVGTFTAEGTFEAVIPHLSALRELGITAIEIMPVAQFPGSRNWGYDGVCPFAVQMSYGGAEGLQELVDACHREGLGVVLDVVYNHLGPEGNYLGEFGPYFIDTYQTPWGAAINFDGPYSDDVRRYFVENARQWIEDFHCDGLRLDAVHAIMDRSPTPFLEELAAALHRIGDRQRREVLVIAESDANDPRLVVPVARGGYQLDAMWSDDVHHAVHTLVTGESNGYYRDFGTVDHLARAWRHGMTYAGEWSPFRHRRHGRAAEGIAPERFVVCAQNHDQVGNRARGDRLSALTGFDGLKLAAAAVLLSPFTPLLFMGEEYGETAPFLYFTSHGDPELVAAVRRGRTEEFAAFSWAGEVPDPQAETTFAASVLPSERARTDEQRALLAWYRTLLATRRRLTHRPVTARALEGHRILIGRRGEDDDAAVVILHFGDEPRRTLVPLPDGPWRATLDSAAPELGGGSRVPARIEGGASELELAPWQALLLER